MVKSTCLNAKSLREACRHPQSRATTPAAENDFSASVPMNRSFIPLAFRVCRTNTHQRSPVSTTVNAIRDFINESSYQGLRTAGFETVKHACFSDGLLQQIHQDSSHQSAGNNGSDAADDNTQTCPSRIHGPVIQEASQAGEGSSDGGRQQIPTFVCKNTQNRFRQ